MVRQVWVQEEDEGQQVGADEEQDEEQVGADEEQDEVGAVAAANRRQLLPLPLPLPLPLLLLHRRQQQHQQQEGSPVEDPRAENATEGTVGVETAEMPSRHHHLLPRSYPPSRSRRP